MALGAIIFDLDGTLVDSNWAHVAAWQRALTELSYNIPAERIAAEIGKGGDKLVPDLLGRQVEEKDGTALRRASAAAFLQIAKNEHFRVFPGVMELLGRLREKGLTQALATSSSMAHLHAILASAGLELKPLMDAVITADDAKATKPSPDLVTAALKKLGVAAEQAAMVGDTQYDAQASRHAGVACIGLLCGGTGNTEEVLRRAGACSVWNDPADLLAHLDEALAAAQGSAPR